MYNSDVSRTVSGGIFAGRKTMTIKNEEIFEVFARLVSIDSPSLRERKMADHVKALFAGIGVNLEEDTTQSITGSDAGNLFGRAEGTGTAVLFAAHMDTVNPALKKKAILHEDGTVTSDTTTVLGADDLSGVTAIYEAVINGKAAHAGFHPEDGINSILAASKAIAVLPQGHIDEITTANIGVICGGSGTNIVSENCHISGEIRSLNHEKALQVLNQYHETFQREAENAGAYLAWEEKLNIHAYETDLDSDAAKRYAAAVEKQKLIPVFEKTFGGSDNNVFAQHGIEGLVIATSMNQVHSCREYTNLSEIAQVTEILTMRREKSPSSIGGG